VGVGRDALDDLEIEGEADLDGAGSGAAKARS